MNRSECGCGGLCDSSEPCPMAYNAGGMTMPTQETRLVWKSLDAGGVSPIQGYKWPLPKNGKPGAWVKAKGEVVICGNGIHGCQSTRAILYGQWLREELYVMELRGPFAEHDDKIAGTAGRLLRRVENWNDCTARLFAADCAEAAKPEDHRSIAAVLAARRFAFGLISAAELAAARAAARDAAWDAAGAAAWAAAGAAAGAAAWAAAGDAARDAQAIRLHAYLTGAVDLDAIRKQVEK